MVFNVARLKRRLALAMLARQDQASLLRTSRARFPASVSRAFRQSPAYQRLYREYGVAGIDGLPLDALLDVVPVLEKGDLFARFALPELLSSAYTARDIGGILTSSGHGAGRFAFAASTWRQLRAAPDDVDLGLELAFGTDRRATLLVNCLPMGVVFDSNSTCVANVSVREDMALAIVDQAGALFEQVVLAVDPLFCKRLLDHAVDRGFDWSRRRMNVILGEEMFSEDFRSYLAARLGIEPAAEGEPLIGSSMGVGELGLNLFFETRETIALRRARHARARDAVLPSYFCFNPLRTFVEVHQPDSAGVGDLVITMLDARAPIPMIRYRTGDRARWLNDEDRDVADATVVDACMRQPFPVIAMLGRERDRIDDGWHVDHFKGLLYRDPRVADALSGAFVVRQAASGLELDIQMRRGCPDDAAGAGARLQELVAGVASSRGVSAPTVRCYSHDSFPHGMGLDYERKFRYFPTA